MFAVRFCNEKDHEKPKVDEEREKSKEEAKMKLKNLLNQIVNDTSSEKDKVKLSHPVKRVLEKRPVYKVRMDKIADNHTAKLVTAVKNVADDIGGDVTQTEAELLHVLLNNQKPAKLTSAAKANLSDVISNMKVEKGETEEQTSRSEQVRKLLASAGKQRPQRKPAAEPAQRKLEDRVDLFGRPPLGIFPKDFKPEPASFSLEVWSELERKELKLMVTHPPQNVFEEMILWTEQGKLWHFPIDNEQGLEEEGRVDFTEHVFLADHLEPWCPAKGPIRHFMELVINGLSKNPYITVEAKKEHIDWFRDYFEAKKKLLQQVGALDTNKQTQKEL